MEKTIYVETGISIDPNDSTNCLFGESGFCSKIGKGIFAIGGIRVVCTLFDNVELKNETGEYAIFNNETVPVKRCQECLDAEARAERPRSGGCKITDN